MDSDELDFTLKAKIEDVVDEMAEIVRGSSRLERSKKGETKSIKDNISKCKIILANA